MYKKTLLAFLILFLFPLQAYAETILEKVKRTGELNAATRQDAIPFAYIDNNNQWTGYSLDLILLIRQELEKQLNRPVKLKLSEITVDDRFEKVEQKKVDLVCDTTTITQERLERVNFSVPYFMTGSQFLVRIQDAPKFDIDGTLEGVPIAYIPKTTTDLIIRQIYPFAKWQIIKSREEGVEKLKKGEVSAVASDGILLIGELVRKGNDPRQFALTPRQPMTTELYGCMMPKNDLAWKQFVDQVVTSSNNQKIQEKWFNIEQGSFPYTVRVAP
ncbi:amino acid ABC transporter substrate-binding protein [Aphanothece hegewaldii CCALA 016]|uniref:Amino acid ABC transporter substrate-binding protein n=1 Tax=Aphanothece hegewaldii CCALA 016 TaxID=2107694 RepID=A0A2T1M2D6_9CHRO|nr:amino acid ABC transporter substrate-binding protein [Aphanothece hegewaldii]PSF38909.1 amino acid ABC transporter substrate-binding protein [Aphanothece hegewaldii CCALA 016]